MSRFLGASSRGGIQSSSLSDGTLTMSNRMLEGVASINGIPPVQITTNTINIAANTASVSTLGSGKQATITADNKGTIKTTLGLANVNNTADGDKPISSAAGAVHVSLDARLTVLESALQVPLKAYYDQLFTESMVGKKIQLYNPASSMYLIQNDLSWGLRTIDSDNVSTLPAIPGATIPNDGVAGPTDDSIFIVMGFGVGMHALQSSITPTWQMGNGTTTMQSNELHDSEGYHMAGAGEHTPSSGMIFVKIPNTTDKYHLSFPASLENHNESQYLINEYLGISGYDRGGYPHLCAVSKLADYSWDLQNALSSTEYPTLLDKAIALSTWMLIEVPPSTPVVIDENTA